MRSETSESGEPFQPEGIFVLPGGDATPPLWTRIYWVRYSSFFRDLDQAIARPLVRLGWIPLTFAYSVEMLRAMERRPDLEVEEEFRLAAEAFRSLDAACRAADCAFGVVRLPALVQCEPAVFRRLVREVGRDPAAFDRELPGARVLAEAAASGIPVLDLLPILEAPEGGRSPFFFREGHPNPAGNRRAAEAIAAWLAADPRFAGR
jgi:hypothetical protein